MLGRVIRDLIRPGHAPGGAALGATPRAQRRRRHQGHPHSGPLRRLGSSAARHRRPEEPDIVCDARDLETLPAAQFDAVYCSHNLEHYYVHDGARVLKGFLHVLKPDGFTEIRVPDIQAVMQHVVQKGMDIGDVLYESPAGPITVRDVLYGYGKEIEQSGQDFYAHKTGFTPKLLHQTLERAGFAAIFVLATPEAFEVRAIGFKSQPAAEQLRSLNLAPREAPQP